jgi:hypothetical protein
MKARIVITELFARRETCQRGLGPFHGACRHRTEIYHARILEVVCDGGSEPSGVARGRIATPSVPQANADPSKPKDIAV